MTDEDAVKQARQLVDAITNLSDQQALIADLLRDVVMKALPSLRAEQQAALDGLQKLTATRRLIKCGHVRRWHCDSEGRLISREYSWRRCFDGQMQGGVAQGIGWALPPMSAVANATADATGLRLQDLPMSPPKLRAAIDEQDPLRIAE